MPVTALRIIATPRSRREAQSIFAHHCAQFLRRCRIDIEVTGTPPRPGKACVVCHNEASFADVMAYIAIMFDHIDRVAAADIYKIIPFVRRASERAGFELLPRGKRDGVERVMARTEKHLRKNVRMGWGGEGRIAGFDGVLRFKVGASLLAIRAGVPIVPVTYYGGHDLLPLWSVRARPGVIRVHFHEPIPTNGLTEEDARDLADRVRAVIEEKYLALKDEAARESPAVLLT